jgi:hypothetical protein
MGETAMQRSLRAGMPKGYELGYRLFSINGRILGHGEPIHVRFGERVLFHILNASAIEIRSLALPQHEFLVALTGWASSWSMRAAAARSPGWDYELTRRRPASGVTEASPPILHCHQQLHMDFGFMALFDYV